jgi:hypothetical protein
MLSINTEQKTITLVPDEKDSVVSLSSFTIDNKEKYKNFIIKLEGKYKIYISDADFNWIINHLKDGFCLDLTGVTIDNKTAKHFASVLKNHVESIRQNKGKLILPHNLDCNGSTYKETYDNWYNARNFNNVLKDINRFLL